MSHKNNLINVHKLSVATSKILNDDNYKHVLLMKINNKCECCKKIIYKNISHLTFAALHSRKNNDFNEYIDSYLELFPDEIHSKNRLGNNLLMVVSRYAGTLSTIETLKIILNHNPKINAVNFSGKTALMFAVTNSLKSSSNSAVNLLINYGAKTDIKDYNGMTAVMLAAKMYGKGSTRVSFVKLMLNNPNYNCMDKYGKKLIHYVFENRRFLFHKKLMIEVLKNTYNLNIEIGSKKLINFLYDEFFDDKIIIYALENGSSILDLIDGRRLSIIIDNLI